MGERKRVTSNIVAVVETTVDGAEGATSNGGLDDELGGIDLPLLPFFLDRLSVIDNINNITITTTIKTIAVGEVVFVNKSIFFFLLVLLHGPRPVEMSLKLFVQAFEINLIRTNKPITAFLHLFVCVCERDRERERERERSKQS